MMVNCYELTQLAATPAAIIGNSCYVYDNYHLVVAYPKETIFTQSLKILISERGLVSICAALKIPLSRHFCIYSAAVRLSR